MTGERSCEVVATRSGIPVMLHRRSGEVMHPGTGPAIEARELYVLPSRLEERLRRRGPDDAESDTLVLFDVGLGAASNAIAAWRVSESLPSTARRLEIVSFDHDLNALQLALEPAHAAAFGFSKRDGTHAAATTLLGAGRHETPRTTWRLAFGEFLDALAREPVPSADVIFWDMFTRRTNPHLWTVAAFRAVRNACRTGATLHTYTTATSARSGLLLASFAVGVGGRSGDREQTTIAATRVTDLAQPLDGRWLDRLARSSAAFPSDVPDDEDSRVAALARVRAHPQFQ